MKKVGVVLSGWRLRWFRDTRNRINAAGIIAAGADVLCFAPDKTQADVMNHLTGEPMAESRNVLIEAARIVREIFIRWHSRCR